MIATIKHDRAKAKEVDRQIDIYRKRATLVDAENSKLIAEIEYLKSRLNYIDPDWEKKEK